MGLPVIVRVYLDIETNKERLDKVRTVVTQACQFELTITSSPFATRLATHVSTLKTWMEKSAAHSLFHKNNESGYWWQGENARLASLAAMVYLAQPYLQDQQLKPVAQLCTKFA